MSAMWTDPQIEKFLKFALGYLLTEVVICLVLTLSCLVIDELVNSGCSPEGAKRAIDKHDQDGDGQIQKPEDSTNHAPKADLYYCNNESKFAVAMPNMTSRLHKGSGVRRNQRIPPSKEKHSR